MLSLSPYEIVKERVDEFWVLLRYDMAGEAVLLSILSEKDTRITGLLLIPYNVRVELKAAASIVCLTTLKLEEGGAGGCG